MSAFLEILSQLGKTGESCAGKLALIQETDMEVAAVSQTNCHLATLEMKQDLVTLEIKEDLATLELKDRLVTLAMTGQLVLWSRMMEGLEVTKV